MHKNSNQSQQKAIQHGTGPAMVLAGPGSGKTFVITNRIKHLIESYHISQEHILVITFTKAASIEMKERFSMLMGNEPTLVQFGTFHAIFFHILQFAYHFDYSNIIKESEKQEYLQEILETCIHRHRSENKLEDEPINRLVNVTDNVTELANEVTLLLSEISRVKNMGIPIDQYNSMYIEPELFREIYVSYRECCQKCRKIDFDDMVLSCYELLRRDSKVRKFWQEKYQYILIDEFQDINYMQYKTMQMLAAPQNNLFVVGDDDQSIYGFRGADPRILQQFMKDFQGAERILLDRNYRCAAPIVEASLQVIQENQFRFHKKIISNKENGDAVVIHAFQSEEEQTANMIHLIEEIHDRGCSYDEIALICRTNTNMGMIAENLMIHKIPFQMKEKISSIYEHFISKDILAYLRFAIGFQRKDFLHIMNKPKRFINRKVCEDEKIIWRNLLYAYGDRPYMQERIKKMEYDISQMQQMNPYAAINYIRKGMGYEAYLKEYSLQQQTGMIEEWIDVLNELQKSAANCKTIHHWLIYVKEVEKKLQNIHSKKQREEISHGVSILTMHGSKGLEYQNVIIPDINEGMIPHKKAEKPGEIEEERRLFYVAMTRAKERLFLFYIHSKVEQKEPSRFLKVLQN